MSNGILHHDCSLSTVVGAILKCLALNVAEVRPRNEEEFREFSTLFKHLRRVVSKEANERRRHEQSTVLSNAHTIYSQVFYLQSCTADTNSYERYAERMTVTMHSLVEQSFTAELRKAQIALGFVEVLCELVVLEVEKFGHSINIHPNCRGIRRSLGNALINLTYKHRESKHKLCAHRSFLAHVTRIIAETPALAQYYGGLVRNLSWNADAEMAKGLQPTVPALVSCVLTVVGRDRRCLLSLLSALWNLASHSQENKMAMCAVEGFLPMLISLFSRSDGGNDVSIVESACGIMKYLSMYFKSDERLLRWMLERNLLASLLLLIGDPSSTPTTVLNAFGVLNTLADGSSLVRKVILTDKKAMTYLEQMQTFPRGETSAGVNQLLGILYNGMQHETPQRPRPTEPHNNVTTTPRAATMPPFVGAANFNTLPHTQTLKSEAGWSDSQQQCRSMSLPRHVEAVSCGSATAPTSPLDCHCAFTTTEEVQYEQFVREPTVEAGTNITDSMQCTRSGSVHSLNSIVETANNSSGWPSTVASSSTVDTQNHSPVSESELPASPSECATLQLQRPPPKSVTEIAADNSGSNAGELGVTVKERGSAGGGSSESTLNTDSYKGGGNSYDELRKDAEKLDDESLLCDMINRVLPKPSTKTWSSPIKRPPPINSTHKQISLLDESIAAAMPSRRLTSSNVAPLIFPAAPFPPCTPPSSRSHHNVTPINQRSMDLIDWDDNNSQAEISHLNDTLFGKTSTTATVPNHDSSGENSLPDRIVDGEENSRSARTEMSKPDKPFKSLRGLPPPLLPKPTSVAKSTKKSLKEEKARAYHPTASHTIAEPKSDDGQGRELLGSETLQPQTTSSTK